MCPLHSQNKHDIWPCVCCLCSGSPVKAKLHTCCLKCPVVLSLLSGSLQQGLEYVENLWILSGGQLWSVFLQPIRGTDLVSESPDQRVQALFRLRCLAVQQHKVFGSQRACVKNRVIFLLQLVRWLALWWWRRIDNCSIVWICTVFFHWCSAIPNGFFDGLWISAAALLFEFFQSLSNSL